MTHTFKTIIPFALISLLAFGMTSVAFAQPETAERTNPAGKSLLIPAHATLVAPNVYSLGTSFDKSSKQFVEGYMIVRPYRGSQKPTGTPGGGGTTSCYGFIASGAKWKTVEPWMVNTTNEDGLTEASVFSLLDSSVTKWESAAAANILGAGSVTSDALVADETTTDGKNEVYFGSLGNDGTIGVTIVWGIFGGKPQNRQLVEWDQVYNTYYDWSDTGLATAMDFESIATHELGHSMGLADLYTSECSEQTMYGYGSEGETKARTLESGDIAGISALY